MSLIGRWSGICRYDPRPNDPTITSDVPFTLKISHGWFGGISGLLIDDPTKGGPEPAPIKGRLRGATIHFTMYRPVFRIKFADKMITLEEYIEQAWGKSLDEPVRPEGICYEGFVSPQKTAMSGSWKIPVAPIRFRSQGVSYEFDCPATSGTWEVRR